MNNIPRAEHPRPQFVRQEWLNLNGVWEFEVDNSESGKERSLVDKAVLEERILVPFCPESELSGINRKDFMRCVWYARDFSVPKAWKGGRILLHFGAVDYFAEVFINGSFAGDHRGGYTPFTFDITDFVTAEKNRIVLRAVDDTRGKAQPIGKQSDKYESYGCSYTRTTGIWQTVWLEHVPSVYIKEVAITPDAMQGSADILVKLGGDADRENLKISLKAYYEGREVGKGTAPAAWNGTLLRIALDEIHLWEPGAGRLYDLELKLLQGEREIDLLSSYFGLRSVGLQGRAFEINGKTVFMRLVLDQGFFPDGIYTAPTDAELKEDILRSMAMGFNGARLHEKVFEPRFMYWADKLGYLCWGEHANWGLDISKPASLYHFLPEWSEVVVRDYSHPSIIGWCPFNETQRDQDPRVVKDVYEMTKKLDPTRPVIDTSGYVHVKTDIYDCHDYEQDPVVFASHYEALAKGEVPFINHNAKETYDAALPFFVSEFGGIWWAPGRPGWGYGKAPKSKEEFIARYRGLVSVLAQNPLICGFCYTQLTDIEQEVNGLYTYDRVPKFDEDIIREITSMPAEIEK